MKDYSTFSHLMDRAVKAERLDLSHRFRRRNIDLTPDQWYVLTILNDQESGLSQNQVAANTFKDAPTISRIIDLLVKKEYVVRQPFVGDRRRYQVVISEKGIEILNRAQPEVEENVREGWLGLDENDFEYLKKITKKVYLNYSR